MGCCTYVPKFPQWNIAVQVWKWSFALGHHVRSLPDITGQVQAQEQNAEEGAWCTAYFRYRKEDDRLKDLWDLGSAPAESPFDAVSFLLPGARRVWYKVREVQGMNLTFANAHLVATLAKLTLAESLAIQPPYPDPDPPPPDEMIATLTAFPLAAEANGTDEIEATLTLLYADLSPVVGFSPTFTSTGDVTITGDTGVTDSSGQSVATATNTTAEFTEFSVTEITGLTSNQVEWTTGPPPGTGVPTYVDAVGFIDDGCTTCDVVNGIFTVTEDTTNNWLSDAIVDDCLGTCYYRVSYAPTIDVWRVELFKTGPTTSHAVWTATAGSVPIGDVIECYLTEGDDSCVWSEHVDIHFD